MRARSSLSNLPRDSASSENPVLSTTRRRIEGARPRFSSIGPHNRVWPNYSGCSSGNVIFSGRRNDTGVITVHDETAREHIVCAAAPLLILSLFLSLAGFSSRSKITGKRSATISLVRCIRPFRHRQTDARIRERVSELRVVSPEDVPRTFASPGTRLSFSHHCARIPRASGTRRAAKMMTWSTIPVSVSFSRFWAGTWGT